MFGKKKPSILPEEKTAQDLINVEDIDKNMLFSNDGWIFGYMYVRANSDALFAEQEKEAYWNNVASALSTEKQIWQLMSIPRTVDISGMISYLYELKSQTKDDARLKLIDGEIAAMQEMIRLGSKEPIILLKLWEKAEKKADITLNKRLVNLKDELIKYSITASILSTQDIVFICKTIADLSEYHSIDDIPEPDQILPVIHGQKRKISAEEQRAALIKNLITPMGGVRFFSDKLIWGGTHARIYGAAKYASELPGAWATPLMNNTDSITVITFNPSNSNQLAAELSKSIPRNHGEANSTKDVRQRKSIEREVDAADKLIDELDKYGESIGYMSLLTMPFSNDEEKFEDVCRNVVNLYDKQKITLRRLGNMQQVGLKHMLPYYTPQDVIGQMVNQIMPLKTLSGGSPMTISMYRDDKGCYFGKTKDGTMMIINLNHRGHDRTNSNIVALGTAGSGKSTAVKHIMETLYMEGWKIVVIDPEREFAEICHSFKGDWLDAGGGKNRINPLEIRPVPKDTEDEEKNNRLFTNEEESSALAMHLKTLKIFFRLYIPELTKLQEALLEKALIELYKDFGIEWNTDISEFDRSKFPIPTNLGEKLEKLQKIDNRYEDISALLFSFIHGSDSFLWNGHTNIQINSRFICFDTNKLNDSSDDVKRAQYFNILSQAWQIMSENRDEPVLLVCDEAYLMIDPNLPQSLMFLRNIVKRDRKYSGALAVVSHSVVDFLDPKVKMYGQAILDISTYKLFFGLDGQNLKELSDLYSLTEEEQKILSAKIQREAICMIGSNRVHVKFDIPQYKLDLMGRGGGR